MLWDSGNYFANIFCLLLVVEACFPVKSHHDAWRSCSRLERGKMNVADETEVRSPICSTFEALVAWFCNIKSGVVMEMSWALSVDQRQLHVLQFSVHLIDLLSILLRCNGFIGAHKAVVDQIWQQTTKQCPWPFSFLVQVWFWKVLWSFFLAHPLNWSL